MQRSQLAQQGASERASTGGAPVAPACGREGAAPPPPLALVSIAVAASALELDKSTVSRYVATHPELNHAPSGAPRVRIEELRAHRAANVNLAKAHGSAARVAKARAEPVGLQLAGMTLAADGLTVTATFRISGVMSTVAIAERLHRAETDERLLDLAPPAAV